LVDATNVYTVHEAMIMGRMFENYDVFFLRDLFVPTISRVMKSPEHSTFQLPPAIALTSTPREDTNLVSDHDLDINFLKFGQEVAPVHCFSLLTNSSVPSTRLSMSASV